MLRKENIPDIPTSLLKEVARYSHRGAGRFNGFWAGGDSLVLNHRAGNTGQIHLWQPGEPIRQLTRQDEPVAEILCHPSREQLVFSRDQGGDEQFHLFLLRGERGDTVPISSSKSKHGNLVGSPCGRYFAFSATSANGRDFNIHAAAWDKPHRPRLLLSRPGWWVPLSFSPRAQRLLVKQIISARRSRLAILDLESGERRFIPGNPSAAYGQGAWVSEDVLCITSDSGEDWLRVLFLHLNSGNRQLLTADIPWDVTQLAISRDRRYLAFTLNNQGYDELYFFDRQTQRRWPCAVPAGVVSTLAFAPHGTELILDVSTYDHPSRLFRLQDFSRLTALQDATIAGPFCVAPTCFSYPTFDVAGGRKRRIPAFCFSGHKSSNAKPVLIYIHGGPASQFRPAYHGLIQHLVTSLALAVIAPNVRGSRGYGKAFLALDDGFKREHAVRDIGGLLEWIAGTPGLDERRTAVIGGSYGGYMVLASMARYARLRAGLERVGISNFVTFLKNTGMYRRNHRRREYGDERDARMCAFLQRISPLTNAHLIRKPLLVAQGRNDPRVPVEESRQIVAAVRRNDVPVWYMEADNEGHRFQRVDNLLVWHAAVVMFLRAYLLANKQ